MKKIALACALVVCGPLLVSAQSVADLQAQVEALLRQLSGLQTRLVEAETRIMPPTQTAVRPNTIVISAERHRFCRAYYRDMRRSITGDDVRALQEFLLTEGLFAGEPTGYFGPITVESLKAWQAREHIVSSGDESSTGWGVFGPRTKQHFMQWCAGSGATANAALRIDPSTGIAPLRVTFYTNISGFRPGIESYVIDYGDGAIEHAAPCSAPADACLSPGENKHTYTKGGTYIARLYRTTSPCPTNPTCLAAESSIALSSVRIHVTDTQSCTKEFKPVCGHQSVTCVMSPCNPMQATFSNRCLLDAAGAAFLYDGSCRPEKANPADDRLCRSWFDGCNSCARERVGGNAYCTEMSCVQGYPVGQEPKPYCKSYFEDDGNKAPVISRFTGPTVLAIGQAGTWSVSASDPENGTLTYKILWGDEARAANTYAAQEALNAGFIQTSTFTHTYQWSGTFTIRVLVRDAAGKESESTMTVLIGGGSVQCPPPAPTTVCAGSWQTTQLSSSGTNSCSLGWVCRPPTGTVRVQLNAMPSYVDASNVSVSWSTVNVAANAYGMYLVLEDTSNQALYAKTVDPLAGSATINVSNGAYCNQFFSDALGPCYIKSGRNYRIRAALFTPPQSCFGYCAPGSPTATISAFTFSNAFKLTGGEQASAPAQSVCTQSAMLCPDGTYVGPTGPQCEFMCPLSN